MSYNLSNPQYDQPHPGPPSLENINQEYQFQPTVAGKSQPPRRGFGRRGSSPRHAQNRQPFLRPSSSPSFKDPKERAKPKVSYQKLATQPSGLLTYQIPSWYPIFCSNMGIHTICELYFRSIQGRDTRMAALLDINQFKYVTCISFIYRCLVVNRENGISGPFIEASALKDAAVGIQLPGFIARYIETLGITTLPSGMKIGPYYQNDLFVGPFCISPQQILEDAERPIPPGHWHIDNQWITEWNQCTTRMSRQAMQFRTVDNSLTEGKPELCVSQQIRDDPIAQFQTIALLPVQLAEEEAKLGACYRWRLYNEMPIWPGNYSQSLWGAFRSVEFDPTLYLERLITAEITTKTVG